VDGGYRRRLALARACTDPNTGMVSLLSVQRTDLLLAARIYHPP
jgi:hypothetical protein